MADLTTSANVDTLMGSANFAAFRTSLKVPASDPTGVTGADAVENIISLTQAEYDAIGAPSATTYYIITDAAAGTLAQFDATTSAQLAGVISDETGTGALVFASSPTLVTPALGTPSALTLTNATGLPVGGITATGTPSGTTYLRGDGAWATPAGGGSGDIVSDLVSAEISVTGATTATISRMHVCSGTTADYTLTLPAASGNAGKMIGVRMAAGLTKLVTIDANSTELIDGEQTRIMWASESAILLCDGTGWSKISGKTRPMASRAYLVAAQSITTATGTAVLIDTTAFDNVGSMVDLANSRIFVRRPGTYEFAASTLYDNAPANGTFQARISKNGTVSGAIVAPTIYSVSGSFPGAVATITDSAVAGDYYQVGAYHTTGSNTSLYVTDPVNWLSVTEIPSW